MANGRDHRRPKRVRVNVLIRDPWWKKISAPVRRCKKAVAVAIDAFLDDADTMIGGGHKNTDEKDAVAYEISILLADDKCLRRLNHRYRGMDRATNILAFTAGDDAGAAFLSGDLALAGDTVCAQAKAAGICPAFHLTHLVVHGTLHLLGMDHDTPDRAKRMEEMETKALAVLSIPDPYRFDRPNMSPDTTRDVAPDMTRDVAPDMTSDTTRDVAPDMSPDMNRDVAPDVARGGDCESGFDASTIRRPVDGV